MIESAQLDPLREIVSISAGTIATSLARFVAQPVLVTQVELRLVELEQALETIIDKQSQVLTSVVKLSGALDAYHVFVAPIELKESFTKDFTTEPTMIQSFWLELANILSGTALTSLSKFLNLQFTQSTPDFAEGSWSAAADAIIAQFGDVSKPILLSHAVFSFPNLSLPEVKLSSAIFCTQESTSSILRSINRLLPKHE